MRFLLLFLLCAVATTAYADNAQPALQAIASAEAVRGDAQSMQPPAAGWQTVAVPDFVNERWPAFNGVIWYRMSWDQADATQPVALVFEYLNMAGAIYVNGILIERDADLIAPISRSWKTPRFLVVEAPLLQARRNEVLVRVSALAEFGPGIGPVSVGSIAAAHARYEGYRFWRQDQFRFTLLIEATLGAFFLLLWFLRRSETAFGWYGVSQLLWFGYVANYIAIDVWPFKHHYDWALASAASLALFLGTFTMFVLRFCARRWPRFEMAMWSVIGLGVLLLFVLPMPLNDAYRVQLVTVSALFGSAVNILLIVLAWRGKAIEPRILSAVALLHIVAVAHDLLAFTRVIPTNVYIADNTQFVNVIGIAALLIWRYARSLQRIENFNAQLQGEVDVARRELADNLQREHETEMAHARIGERLNLARDLHDGFGSSLMGGLAALEHAPESLSTPQLVKLLRDLRDELRLIVDTSMQDAQAGATLAAQIVPLRHRLTRLLEAKGIACRWSLVSVDDVRLASTRTLDVLRFLQEALTNVLKHSGARTAAVEVSRDGDRLHIAVSDDGTGIAAVSGHGAGMASMRARARRLGGEFDIDSVSGRTRVALRGVPIATP